MAIQRLLSFHSSPSSRQHAKSKQDSDNECPTIVELGSRDKRISFDLFLLSQVFKFIPSVKELVSIGRVCRAWRTASLSDELWYGHAITVELISGKKVGLSENHDSLRDYVIAYYRSEYEERQRREKWDKHQKRKRELTRMKRQVERRCYRMSSMAIIWTSIFAILTLIIIPLVLSLVLSLGKRHSHNAEGCSPIPLPADAEQFTFIRGFPGYPLFAVSYNGTVIAELRRGDDAMLLISLPSQLTSLFISQSINSYTWQLSACNATNSTYNSYSDDDGHGNSTISHQQEDIPVMQIVKRAESLLIETLPGPVITAIARLSEKPRQGLVVHDPFDVGKVYATATRSSADPEIWVVELTEDSMDVDIDVRVYMVLMYVYAVL